MGSIWVFGVVNKKQKNYSYYFFIIPIGSSSLSQIKSLNFNKKGIESLTQTQSIVLYFLFILIKI